MEWLAFFAGVSTGAALALTATSALLGRLSLQLLELLADRTARDEEEADWWKGGDDDGDRRD